LTSSNIDAIKHHLNLFSFSGEEEDSRRRNGGNTMTFRSSAYNGALEEVIRRRTWSAVLFRLGVFANVVGALS